MKFHGDKVKSMMSGLNFSIGDFTNISLNCLQLMFSVKFKCNYIMQLINTFKCLFTLI